MSLPLVSIIMPCFNGEAYLTEAIESVLAQTFRDFELIVVNDGSTDRSVELLEGYRDRIKVIHQPNLGVSTARNVGIDASRGDFIAFLDSDDYWDPEFLEQMVKGMADPRTGIAYCGWQNVGAAQGEPFVPPDYESSEKMHHLLRFASLWPIHAILIRRRAMPSGPAFNPQYPACEDYDLWLRIASFYRIQLVPRVLAFYRKHAEPHATSDQARVARYNLHVKRRFLSDFPALKRAIPKARLREYYAGGVLDRGYRCLWKGDLGCAHEIFRLALVNRLTRLKDLKYAIPAILPFNLYLRLAKYRARASSS